MEAYGSLLIHIVIALGFALSVTIGSLLFGRIGKAFGAKDGAYECGMLPKMSAQPRFSVKFYLVAMIFILFDIEVVFMVPWALAYRSFLLEYGTTILWSMLSFVAVLMVGYLYAVKKGALDWKS